MSAEAERPGGRRAGRAGARPGNPGGQPDPGDGGCGGSVLNVEHLSLSFGGLRALSELDPRLTTARSSALIGPNGAGKTTVFNVITGVYEPSSGDVRFAGQSIAGQPQHTIARKGIARPSRACGCS
jgi:ABC-type uncharacterized transport system ATPase subunit